MESMAEILLEYGSLGIFLAFMVYQHQSMQKRMDALQDKFLQNLSDLQEKADEKEASLRARYDAVIEQYQSDKSVFRSNVAGQVQEVKRKLIEVEKTIAGLPFSGIQLQLETISMAIRNAQTILEKGMEALDKIEEEKKIKAMAQKLSEKD
tara:strand:+ start:4863 stop:5315 length:453 start_codon:yes stop_codon:yes gene_type:complete